MKIRMLTSFAGTGFTVSANEETQLFSAAEALRMIEAGYAVPVDEQKVERATKRPAPEKRG